MSNLPVFSKAQLLSDAKWLHISLSEQATADYGSIVSSLLANYAAIDAIPDDLPTVNYAREAGRRPAPEEACGNAWYWKATIKGSPSGKLASRTLAIKDNINIANIPMMNGSVTLEGHIPQFDATVVSRVLDSGGTILGKATCEQFCLSGGSHTSDTGPVHNPRQHGRMAGGSSSGSAALVAAGEVDMALGTDQGGSIRIPSAFCGVYGMKPTHGLVPYTGIMPIEATIDHCGPITNNVRDNATLLEVIAGRDGLDSRQYDASSPHNYTETLEQGVKGLRIAILNEGCEDPMLSPEVLEKIMTASRQFESLGAEVMRLSMPQHRTAAQLWTPIGCEGLLAQMLLANGGGYNNQGLLDTPLVERNALWREQADALSPSLKACMFAGAYGMNALSGRVHAKAQNIRIRIKKEIEDIFGKIDLLLMPTVPFVAKEIPSKDAPILEIVARALDMIGNTTPYNISGHPAMSVPCGTVDGLPVGMMLVGKYNSEATIYRAAAAYEASTDWMKN